MKYLRLISDLHLEFDVGRYQKTRVFNSNDPAQVAHLEYLKQHGEMGMCWFPPTMSGDKTQTALVIAGDLWVDHKFLTRKFEDGESWLKKVSKMFKYVVFVLGNHDYWHTNLLYEAGRVKVEIKEQGLMNVFLLENDVVVRDDVKFIGGTLWTDFHRNDPLVMRHASFKMNDYVYMRYGREYRKAFPQDTYNVHMNTKRFIFENAKRDYPEQKVVVVTHMAPSFESINKKFRIYRDQLTNFCYFTDLEERIKADGGDIDFWLHGHVHMPVDYTMSPNVRVLCQPRGYEGQEHTDYDPKFRIVL